MNISRTKPMMTIAFLGIGLGVAYFAHKFGLIDKLMGKEKTEKGTALPNGKAPPNEGELADILADLEDQMQTDKRPILPESGITRDLGGAGITSYQNAPTSYTGGYPTPVPTGAGLFPASAFYDPNYLSMLYNAQSYTQEQNPQTTVVDYFDPNTPPTAPEPAQSAYARSYMGARNFRHRKFGNIKDCAYKMDYDRGYIIKNSENRPPYYRPITVALS